LKIALIGASGFVGQAVLTEALTRDHSVTGLVRNPSKLTPHPALTPLACDVFAIEALAQHLAGHDAVVHAFNPGHGAPDICQRFIAGTQAILQACHLAGVRRLLVVGGAGSLFVAPGLQLVDTPEFPAIYKEVAEGARQALNLVQAETALDWTFISPSAVLEPGERTGQFRLGGDQLLLRNGAPTRINVADLAVAIVDELEQPQHLRQRFTARY